MKWISRIVGAVVTVIVLLTVAVLLIPKERLARIAADQIEAATGRAVEIGGPVSLTLWPVIGLRVEDLSIGNADWAGPEPMFEVASAAIAVDPLGLPGGAIRVTGIEAQAPTVRLERRLDGRVNWQTGAGAAAPVDAPDPPAANAGAESAEARVPEITIARIEVSDARFLYAAEGSETVVLDGMDLTLDWPEPDGGATIALTLAPAGDRIDVALDVGTFAAFMAGAPSPVDARITSEQGEIRLSGQASTEGALSGRLALETADTDAFLAAFGLPAAGLPPKLGQSIAAGGEITLTPDLRLALRALDVDLGGNRVTGAADISLAGVPQVNARLDAGVLDLETATATGASAAGGTGSGGGAASSGGSGPGGWPTDTIDASALGLFNGDIALSAEAIKVGGFTLGQTRAVLKNDAARMVFELREVAAYDGMTTGEFVINNRNGLSVGGRMKIAGVEMQRLLADAADIDRITGSADLELSFLGAGPSVDAIMRSLSGDGALRIGRGTLLGIDLDRLFSGGGTGGTTIFDDLSATWTVAQGVLNNRDLLMQLKNYRVSGEGRVDLGNRSLDYRVTPVALRANSGQGLAIPVLFQGPWSGPSIRPDLEAAAGARIDAEKDRLEERAREKIGEELGIAPVDGKTTEDAIKEELKDRLLRKLFE